MCFGPAGYMQMTVGQAESWSRDANTYVADEEEDTFRYLADTQFLLSSTNHVSPCQAWPVSHITEL